MFTTKNLNEYYLELMRFISLLKDSHTSVWFPNEIEVSDEYSSKLPVIFNLIQNDIVIYNVKKVVEKIVKPYSIVRKINRISAWEYIEQKIYPYIWHENRKGSFEFVNKFLRNGLLNSKMELKIEYNNEISLITLTRTKGDGYWSSLNIELIKEPMNEMYNSPTH